MPNVGSILREEIKRLALRVTRPVFTPLKKDVAVLKRTIAEHKRALARLQSENARLVAEADARLMAPPAISDEELKSARISPRLIRSQRNRLGLSRDAFAKLLGVSSGSVFAWEGGRSKPRAAAKVTLVAIRKLGRREARRRLERALLK